MKPDELERFRQLCADEPPPRRLCAVCFKPRRPERSKRYAGEAATLDPFCSNTCAREFHGTSLAYTPGPAARAVAS